jgi:hypothetical protein
MKNLTINGTDVVINHASATRKGTGYYVLECEVEINGTTKKIKSGTHDMEFIDSLDSKFDIEAIYNHKESTFEEQIAEAIYFLQD